MYIELQRGREFRGLTKYCIYDSDGQGSDRVSFIETRNLATSDAEVAWKIMASKFYMQNELKARAGVSTRKNNGKPVGHLFISWGKEEAEAQNLDQTAMTSTVDRALKAIGAKDYEATIVGHRDTENPHCHVILCLIGNDGRLKKNWKEKEKLSKFALEEEIRVHGKPIVEDRHKRWHDREAGESPTPKKKKTRHLYELERAAEGNNILALDAGRLLKAQKELEQNKADQKILHRKNRERLNEIWKERERRIQSQNAALIRRAKTNARKLFDKTWKDLHKDHRLQQERFNANEKTIRGSVENALRMTDWFQVFQRPKDSGRFSLKNLFQIVTSEGHRRSILDKEQEKERKELRKQQNKAEREAATLCKKLQKERISQTRQRYVQKSLLMKERQERQAEQIKEAQQKLTLERNVILKEFRLQERERKRLHVLRQKIQEEFHQITEREEESEETGRSEQSGSTKPARTRKPRDPNRSRRKRDIEKRQQGIERASRFDGPGDRHLDFER